MIGILIYLFFLLTGYAYSRCIFKDKDIYFTVWMGGIFGNILLMAGIVLPAMFFDFTVLSHLLLIIISVIPLVFIMKQRKANVSITSSDKSSGVDLKVFAFLILPLTLLTSVILANHILTPVATGGVASGQSTYGDLQMHLGFVSGIAEQKIFPPNYPFLDGYKLNYPFFINMLSSSLYIFGTPLRLSVLIPSYVIVFLLVTGFYILTYKITQKKSSSVLATVLFFLGGGFGFAYFLSDIDTFTSIFTKYYHTPTNFLEYNLRWVNPICDMIVPQRTTMAGWCMLLPALWLLIEAVQSKKRLYYIILGVIAGAMPMIHTHSFLALGIISAILFLLYFPYKETKKDYIISWVCYGVIAVALAAPQLFYWTFSQTADNESFLRFGFNWVNDSDPYLWFYIKNWGITALFAIPAIMYASKDNKKLLIACGVIFCLAEFIIFQPNEYDNNKLFFVVYMILITVVSDWLIYMWKKLKKVKYRSFIAAVIILAGTLSGTLSIIREYISGGDYETYSAYDIEMAEYIKENIPADAVVLTSAEHLNPVVTLAGRNIYLGSSLYVYFHGFGEEYYTRLEKIKAAYTGTYEELHKFCKENGIDYVYVGANEKSAYKISQETLLSLERVYNIGTETMYKIN